MQRYDTRELQILLVKYFHTAPPPIHIIQIHAHYEFKQIIYDKKFHTLQLPVVAAHKKCTEYMGKCTNKNYLKSYVSHIIISHNHSCYHYVSDDSTCTSTLVAVNAIL